MKRKTLLAAAIAATLSSASQAQNVTVNRQDFGICAGSPLSTFGGWVAIAAGRVCSSGSLGESASSGTVDWTFTDGPVEFNGLYFSGSGTFFLEILDGEDVIHTTQFASSGMHHWIGITHEGDVSRVRVRRETGVGAFGIVDIPLDPATNQSGAPQGNGPNGSGPDGNGPPGNGPHGNGPPGNGPDGNGPPGNGPDGNGPPGPPDNNGSNNGDNGNTNNVDDELDELVNQTNAAPEPVTILLVASGLGGVGALARRRNKRRNDEA